MVPRLDGDHAGAAAPAPATIGYAPDAALRLPRRYELDESRPTIAGATSGWR